MGTFWDKQSVVLLHPPKTGGTALRKLFTIKLGPGRNTGMRHVYMSEICQHRDILGGLPPEEVTWLITVRHPYERMVSAYKFFGYYKKGYSMDSFAMEYVKGGKNQHHRMGCPMVSWLDMPLPVRVYKCENLSVAFPEIGISRPSYGPSSDMLLTDKAVKLANDAFAADFERFGYEKE